jgi:hypothetical protein
MYFIDGGATALVPSSAVTANGAGLKISSERNNGIWEGGLSADGKTLDATWTQEDERRPLVLTHATADTAWTIPDPPPLRQVMDPKGGAGVQSGNDQAVECGPAGFPNWCEPERHYHHAEHHTFLSGEVRL